MVVTMEMSFVSRPTLVCGPAALGGANSMLSAPKNQRTRVSVLAVCLARAAADGKQAHE